MSSLQRQPLCFLGNNDGNDDGNDDDNGDDNDDDNDDDNGDDEEEEEEKMSRQWLQDIWKLWKLRDFVAARYEKTGEEDNREN